MKKKIRDVWAEQQRVIILQLLANDADCRLNNRLLQKGLEMCGHNISIDKVDCELAWLEDKGLVEVEERPEADLSICTLTESGLDVVKRRRVLPGVDMPIKGL